MSYHAGPYLADLKDPFEVARGPLEGRQALFVLREVSDLGVLVQRMMENREFGDPIFMPWGAVQSIAELPALAEVED